MAAKAVSMTKVFDQVGYHPHAAQIPIHRARAKHRFRIVCAGRRTGKSTVGGHELTTEAWSAFYQRKNLDKFKNRREYWIVGPEYSDAEKEFRILWGDLVDIGFPMDHPGSYNNPEQGDMHVSLFGGKFQVHAMSAKYPGTLVGEGLAGVIMAEAAKLKPSVWHKYIRPTLADLRAPALFSSTPEGKNWFYELFMQGLDDSDPEYWSTRIPSWANNVLFPGGGSKEAVDRLWQARMNGVPITDTFCRAIGLDPEIASLGSGQSKEEFNQEIAADFTDFIGAVFKDFDEELHVGNYPYSPKFPVYIATDYGFTNPSVVLFIQVDTWDNIRVVAEFYRPGLTDEELAESVLADDRLAPMVRAARLLYPDPADPSASVTLERRWKVTRMRGTGGDLNDRLNLIRRFLKNFDGNGKPTLAIDVSCRNLIREMGEMRYPKSADSKTNERELPVKLNDHAPEALGRFMAGRYAKTGERAKATQRTAIAGRRT